MESHESTYLNVCADPNGDPDDVEMHVAEANEEPVEDLQQALDGMGLGKDWGDKPYERLRRLAQRYTLSTTCNSVAWTKLMHQHMYGNARVQHGRASRRVWHTSA